MYLESSAVLSGDGSFLTAAESVDLLKPSHQTQRIKTLVKKSV